MKWPSRYAPHRVANGFVEIVAFHQDREEARDGTFLEVPRALENLRQHRKHRWRVAFLAGRFAGRQSDFALRHRQAGHRIHHQQHVLALIAEVFGHRQRDETGADAQRRRPVRSRHHNHRAAAPFRSQFVFKERPHFAIAFAHQRDHADVGVVVPRHHAQQRAFADAAASENPDALSFAARQQSIDGANARHQRLGDVFAVQRLGRRGIQRIGRRRLNRRTFVHADGRIRPARARAILAQPATTHRRGARSRDRPVASRPSLPAASTIRARCGSRSPAIERTVPWSCAFPRSRRWKPPGRARRPAVRPSR